LPSGRPQGGADGVAVSSKDARGSSEGIGWIEAEDEAEPLTARVSCAKRWETMKDGEMR